MKLQADMQRAVQEYKLCNMYQARRCMLPMAVFSTFSCLSLLCKHAQTCKIASKGTVLFNDLSIGVVSANVCSRAKQPMQHCQQLPLIASACMHACSGLATPLPSYADAALHSLLHSSRLQQPSSSCLVYAGWKESQKVFTDALADLITAGSSAYAATEFSQHRHRPAGTRRMLATPQNRDTSYPAAQSSFSTTQSNLNADSIHSTAHSLESVSNTLDTTARMAENADSSSTAHVLGAEAASSVASAQKESQLDTCQADAGSSVCADKDQPVLAPQAWEQEEPSPGLKLQQCQLLNASLCEPTVQMSKDGKGFMVAVYNALAWERATEPIRVPLDESAGSVASWVVTGQWQCLLNKGGLIPMMLTLCHC